MTNEELIEIHLNNSDLGLGSLTKIHNSTLSVVRAIITNYYEGRGRTYPSYLEPQAHEIIHPCYQG
jgi:hypothetical protein